MLWVLPVKPLMTVFSTYPSHWARTWVSGSGRDSVRRLLLGLPGSRAAQKWRAHNRYWNSVWTRHPARAVAAAPCRTPQSLCGPDDHLRIGHTSGTQGEVKKKTHTNNQTHTEKYTHISNKVCFYLGVLQIPSGLSIINQASCANYIKNMVFWGVSIGNCIRQEH